MRHDEITNNTNIIDSRDIIARIETLEGERDGYPLTCRECGSTYTADEAAEPCPSGNGPEDPHLPESTWVDDNPDEAEELAALVALQDEAEGYSEDWRHGATLIRDSYFETYARDFAEDIGAINHDARWPATCIDWERAARDLQMDYTSVEFDGVTYWVR